MPERQPDIIWIVGGQLHYQAIEYAGNLIIITSNIDCLAGKS